MAWLSGTLHGHGFGALWRPERFSDDPNVLASISAKGRRTISDCFDAIEGKLSGPYSTGDAFTAADPYLLVFYRWGNGIGFDLATSHPNYTSFARALVRRASVVAALAVEGIGDRALHDNPDIHSTEGSTSIQQKEARHEDRHYRGHRLVGSGILSESLDRGHDVTAIVTNLDRLPTHPRLNGVKGDVAEREELASLIAGHDVVISAFNPGKDARGTGTRSIIAAVKQTGGRLVVVGGAGSLEVAPGRRLVDQPDFPAEWKPGSLRTAAFLDDLRGETGLDWNFLCPAAMLTPGERTGTYRVGGDQLLSGDDGQSRISIPDYAVAMLDEVESPRHPRQRFSVAY